MNPPSISAFPEHLLYYQFCFGNLLSHQRDKSFQVFLLAHQFINVPTLFIILLFYNGNAAKLDFAFGHNYIIAQVLLLNKQKN